MAASLKLYFSPRQKFNVSALVYLRGNFLFQTPFRNASFWKRSKEEEQKRKLAPKYDGVTERDRMQILKKRTSVQTVKGYKPRDDVREMVEKSVTDIFGHSENWEELSLEERGRKYNLLTKLMKEFDHEIPNLDLHNMKTAKDVVRFFETEVKDTSTYEDLSKLDLPKNLHIQLEPVRFSPETDTMFKGKTAFPGRPTVVTSIKYRRKYKGHDGGAIK